MSEENVLVVDDEAVIRDVCERILTNEGYTVTTAASGKEALRLVSKNDYDAVVTDIMMPDMATQSDHLGAREFVVKPFTPDELSQAVQKALKKRVINRG